MGPVVFRLRQLPEVLDVVLFAGDEAVHHRTATFAQLCREQPRFVNDQLVPILDQIGILPPPSRCQHAVVDAVIARLFGRETTEDAEVSMFIDVMKLMDDSGYLLQLVDVLFGADVWHLAVS